MKKLFLVVTFLLLTSFVNKGYSVVTTIPAGAGPYATLGAAFTAINAGGVYAGVAVTVTINANEVLAAPVGIGGPAATFTSLLLRPSGAVTISGNFNEALIIVDGADFVTIDGLNTAGNSLTLTNSNTGTSPGSVRLSNGATNNTLINLTCNGVGVGATQGGRTLNVGQSTAGTGGNNNNTIERCTVNGGRRGIQTFGTAGATGYTNDNTVIKNCIVKNCSSLGIFIGSETRDNTVQDCEIYDDPATVAQDVAGYRAIGLQGVGTNNILRNKIHDLESTNPATTYIAMISIPAPLTAPGSNTTVINIINNFVNLNRNNEAAFIYGIAPLSNATTTPYTANVFYNTVRLSGSSSTGLAGQYTGAYPVDVEIAGSIVNFKNNVGINDRTGGDATSLHIGVDLTAYPFAGITLNSDYNLSYASDTVNGWAGGFKGSIFNGYFGTNLLKDTACQYGVEQHSIYRNIPFAAANTYKLGLIGGDMAATPLAAVTTDIDGEPRNANFPYKGCDEKATALRVLDLGGVLEAYDPNAQITVLLLTACSVTDLCTSDLIGNGTFQSSLTFGDAVPNGSYTLDVLSLNHIETYSAAAVAFGGPTVSYDFKPSVSTAFGNNLTGGAAPHAFFAGDRNQDGIVDLTDLSGVFNDASSFVVGCRLPSDMNGDEQVDLTDLVLTFNNSSLFVQVANPCPEPSSIKNTHSYKVDLKNNMLNESKSKLNVVQK